MDVEDAYVVFRDREGRVFEATGVVRDFTFETQRDLHEIESYDGRRYDPIPGQQTRTLRVELLLSEEGLKILNGEQDA